jgi:hypothetical protein
MRKSFCVAASSAALAGEVDEMATGADSIFKSWQAYVFINHLEINLLRPSTPGGMRTLRGSRKRTKTHYTRADKNENNYRNRGAAS